MDYAEYLLTPHWQKKRREALKYYGNNCFLCSSTQEINVHHRTYKNLWKEPMGDLAVLCKKCHYGFHEEVVKIRELEFELNCLEDISVLVLYIEPSPPSAVVEVPKKDHGMILRMTQRILNSERSIQNGQYVSQGCICGKCKKSHVEA